MVMHMPLNTKQKIEKRSWDKLIVMTSKMSALEEV